MLNSVDKITAKRWKKILESAEAYVGVHCCQPSADIIAAQARAVSGRATCYEPDSD